MATLRQKRPRIGDKSNIIKIAKSLSELYEIPYFEALKIFKSQDQNITNTKMILNLKSINNV